MIRTKQPQVLDAINRIESIVYMEAKNMSEDDDNGTVKFRTVLSVIVNDIKTIQVEKTLQNEQGDDYIVFESEQWVYPRFKELLGRDSIYKMTTFDALFNNLTRAQFKSQKDLLMIQEVNTVNNTICDPLEKNCNYFWYLQINDMEVVTQQQLEELLTPYKLEV
jgi:hypothetical protein